MDPKISDSVWYIGADDCELDLFESQYPIPQGVSYNSYVILDEKVAVMDTIDRRRTDAWLENLEKVLDGRKPDYLIVSHMEPDHAYNIGLLADRYPEMKLVGNAKTFPMLSRFFDLDLTGRQVTVAEGDTLSLGRHTLTFYMAPMVHWPEVMVTYESTEKLLFSADAFGKFGALEGSDPNWVPEARRYYFNIVGKYGVQAQALLKKAAGLDIAKILPLHGPVLEGNLTPYVEKYQLWSSYEPETSGVALAYCSVYGNTAQAAQLLRELLEAAGVEVASFDLARCDLSQAVEAAFRYDRLVLAAPTYDGGIFPPMDDFLAHLKSKNFQRRKVGLIENGSWAPMSGKLMAEKLAGMKDITVLEPKVTVSSAVKAETETALRALAEALAQ